MAGITLLAENSWETYYDLTIALNMERSECEYFTGHFMEAEETFESILKNAKTNLEKARVYNIKELMYLNLGKLREAIDAGVSVLKLLGLDLSTAPGQAEVDAEIERVKLNLGDRNIPDLIYLPEMTEPEQLAMMKLLMEIIVAGWWTNKGLFYLVTAKMVNLSLTYGSADGSADSYAWYGLILGSGMGDYKSGYEFGELALKLNERFKSIRLNPRVSMIFGLFVQPWRSHLKIGLEFVKKAYQVGLEVGDWLWASIISFVVIYEMLLKGDNLDDVHRESQVYLDFARRTKQAVPINMIIFSQRLILNLKGLTRKPGSFGDDAYDEEMHVQEIRASGALRSIYWYCKIKLQALYLFDHYDEALKIALESDELTEGGASFGAVTVPEHYLYYSLTLTALYPTATTEEREHYAAALAKNQAKLKIWADNCPENFLHKYLLVTAEMARLEGNDQEAMAFYEQSIKSARENEYTQNEAIANELAAKFYLAKGFDTVARAYLMEARYGYLRWGATAKVNALDDKYPQLLAQAALPSQVPQLGETQTITPTMSSTTGTGTEATLDLETVMKASQSLSGEIVLDQLLEKLMRIVIENAGAQKGFLILEKAGKLVIEASGEVEREGIVVLESIPVETSDNLSTAIINYVARTDENVVLNDAAHEGLFTTDAYITTHQPKSVLCAPLINQGKRIGVLYLENNLSTGAFTPGRLELLQLLSTQAGISIENARLYADLAQNEQRYRRLFADSRDSIFITTPLGQIIDANQATSDLFGYSQAELMRKHALEFYANPADRREFQRVIEREGAVRDFELKLIKKNGKQIDGLLTATARRDNDGTVLAYQCLLRDITERKRAEEALRESEARFRTLVEHAPEAIVVLDIGTGYFVEANDNVVHLFGVEREAIPSMGPAETSPPSQPDGRSSAEAAQEKIQQALEGKVPVFEWMHRNTTGHDIPCEVRLVRLPASGRHLVRASIVDITERKQAEQLLANYNRRLEKEVMERTQELSVKNNELESTLQKLTETQNQLILSEKMASLGALTAGIAHEIKNPLNFVNNFAELSMELTQELLEEIQGQKEQLDAEPLEILEEILADLQQNVVKINQHGKRADGIVRGMLMHSRGQAGKRQATDINALLNEYVNLAYHGLRARDTTFNIAIETDYDDSIPPIEVVPQDISRVFLNVINNSCYAVHEKKKASGEGFASALWVRTKNLGNRVEIRIRDNGDGISKDLLDKIFNPFFSTKPTGQGTGLGLSISYDIVVAEHSGEIQVETEIGNYTEFIITLPSKWPTAQCELRPICYFTYPCVLSSLCYNYPGS